MMNIFQIYIFQSDTKKARTVACARYLFLVILTIYNGEISHLN